MKRVHIVSEGDSYMYRLAVALKEKGYEVSCSGTTGSDSEELLKKDILLEDLSHFSDTLRDKIDYVVPAVRIKADHPEIIKAKELGFLVIAFPDFILRMAKDKSRLVISDAKYPTRILSMVYQAIRKQNMRCDYVVMNQMKGLEKRITLSYDARMILLEGDEYDTFMFEKRPTHHLYRPHILLMPDLKWKASESFPTLESYQKLLKEMVVSIERDGKFIYNESIPYLQELAQSVREDITAIPYNVHRTVTDENGEVYLDTRFGNVPVLRYDTDFLSDINAARLACRQLGVNDKEFYNTVPEFEFND
ncbi:UDP-N-acetylmuramate--alanine ligase [Coprobacter tertius]|uniref:UDP-N-acetylmuramate--alanine ligase n=1 Tax=Coprobacter tertius TaxID=2944915 RepID=A0ABT1MH11_9BACT|nr:UDP-N-acetylmuramate--alanine ligase [Coprobacter tertius]MCP9611917.1 UDP-N-acetylmuramate--alanine ligase [Coprobacter tertius]